LKLHENHSNSFWQPRKWPVNRKKNLGIFMVSFLLASLFWTSAALSEKHLASIDVAVDYQNLPEDKVVTNKLPAHLELGVLASGWQLLQTYFSDQWRVSIDVDKRSANNMFTTNAEPDYFSKQLPDGFEVKYVNPGVLYFEFDNSSSKYIKIKLNKNLHFAALYELAGPIIINPDSVLISGPGRIVDTMNYIPTQLIQADKLNKSLSGIVKLQLPDGINLTLSQNTVKYSIPIDQFTESYFQVPIHWISADSQQIQLLSNKIQVYFQLPMQKIKILKDKKSPSLFKVIANVNNINTETMEIGLELKKYPSWAHKPRLVPDKVSFLYQY